MIFVKQGLVCKWDQTVWICCLLAIGLLVSALQASAQVRPPRRKHRIMVDPAAKNEKPLKADIGASLKDIAKRATQHAQNPKVDVVFVVDGSRQMSRHIAALENRLTCSPLWRRKRWTTDLHW